MSSILDQIKAKRSAEISTAEMCTDLEIPTWGRNGHPRAWFRVRPVPLDVISNLRDKAAKAKGPAASAAMLKANASVVSAATVEVLIGEGDDQAAFVLNDDRLLEALGIPGAAAGAQVVMALVGNDQTGADGYVIALADKVAEHSGYTTQIVEERLLGD